MVDIEKLERVLLELGHTENLRGFDYLMKAVEQWEPGTYVTKELYPAVAAAFATAPERVERNIRHSIEKAWERNDPEVQRKYFGGSVHPQKGSPTNGEYIARLWRVCRAD